MDNATHVGEDATASGGGLSRPTATPATIASTVPFAAAAYVPDTSLNSGFSEGHTKPVSSADNARLEGQHQQQYQHQQQQQYQQQYQQQHQYQINSINSNSNRNSNTSSNINSNINSNSNTNSKPTATPTATAYQQQHQQQHQQQQQPQQQYQQQQQPQQQYQQQPYGYKEYSKDSASPQKYGAHQDQTLQLEQHPGQYVPVFVLETVVAERDSLRIQNEQLWTIIERQRTIMSNLQGQLEGTSPSKPESRALMDHQAPAFGINVSICFSGTV
ncbi:hypothetical protein BASA60_009404 [Batrachochytrium salamandrivorans]|nr:hypothetical protein BASA60_009404 [Batrachochytrium salamandrivorans]